LGAAADDRRRRGARAVLPDAGRLPGAALGAAVRRPAAAVVLRRLPARARLWPLLAAARQVGGGRAQGAADRRAAGRGGALGAVSPARRQPGALVAVDGRAGAAVLRAGAAHRAGVRSEEHTS